MNKGPIKITRLKDGTMRAEVRKQPAGLTRDERRELVDILRKNFLYQTPTAAWPNSDPNPDPRNPAFLILRMLPGHWEQMMRLINKAGGWTMPEQPQSEEVQ